MSILFLCPDNVTPNEFAIANKLTYLDIVAVEPSLSAGSYYIKCQQVILFVGSEFQKTFGGPVGSTMMSEYYSRAKNWKKKQQTKNWEAGVAAQAEPAPAPKGGDMQVGQVMWDADLETVKLKGSNAHTDQAEASSAGMIFASPKKTKTTPGVKVPKTTVELLAVGADVENFLIDKDGKPVPCIELIGGTKEAPIPLKELGEGFAVQEDNVLLEYNIPPAKTRSMFVYNIMRIQEELRRRVAEKGLVMVPSASMHFTQAQLDHPQARRFGCEPDFNVWERRVNDSPKSDSPETATLRTAGGHIHVSFNVNDELPKFPEHITEMETVVMGMDVFIGIPSVILDKDTERRKLYGKAGAHRRKPYGIEWRTSSPWWTSKPEYMEFVFDQVQRIFNFIKFDGLAHTAKWLRTAHNDVTHAINDNDVAWAQRVCRNFGIRMPEGE